MILEKAEISPSGRFCVNLMSVVEDLDFPDEAPILLSRKEQWFIIQKLEEEGFVQNIELDEKKQCAHLEMTKLKKRHSNLYSYIKTIDDFLQQRELFEKFIKLIDIRSIKPKHIYTIPTEESNDDLIQLLIDLDLAEYDWKEIEKQTYRDIGNRIIEFTFTGDKVIELNNRVSGKNTRIKRQVLELISKDIGERFTFIKIVEIFIDFGVPESMFIQDTKWRAVFYILSYYASSQLEKDYLKTLKIIQETMHPLMFGGDEEKAKESREKYNKWLKYDHVYINDDGKIYSIPTDEEWDLGIIDWIDVDGKTLNPIGFFIQSDHIAELWVLWSQVVILVSAYQENPFLNYKILENLYLEIIEKVEKVVKQGDIGCLSEEYKRPFISLATAKVETYAKKTENPSILIGSFLSKISGLNPSPSEIIKKKEENADLIERVRLSTNVMDGEKIDKQKFSYERDSQEPIKVQIIDGKMKIEGLQDGLESITQTKKDNKNRFPYKLPAGTTWNNIIIKFEDDEKVYIQVKQFKLSTDYKEMGFVGAGKKPKPSEMWAFLRILAERNGELTIKDREAKDKYKKQKQLLAKSLQSYFSLDYDPFYPYNSSVEKQGNSYKIKITLIPSLIDSKKPNIVEESDNLGIKEYLETQTPQIYEE